MKSVTEVNHPLVQHKMTLLRRKETSVLEFRQLLREIGWFLGAEATKDLKLIDEPIETPVTSMVGKKLDGKKVCLISILRAGDGLIQPMLDLIPSARIGVIGLARDEETLMPTKYCFKVPKDLENRVTIVVDPMLATAGSAIFALDEIKKAGAKDIRFISLVSSPEGVKALHDRHPDVPLITAAIDDHLNEAGYIVPGLGDAGDRIFGTKGV
ncbi:uracil phosphoribosyltransferase [Kordiimonas sediminis]|uniref:Uracil phosphoribosyltransferase n=1 Tax=Kordiimonas sediminis TaxID=1735581 RepID=A0A919E6I6_9PROT|nr:uracil phosphoribosyltransferase [Kordiimonas sediminis]GHF19045.1 uracil phosphoribosyltransferase [Kordiimonas sediminis]